MAISKWGHASNFAVTVDEYSWGPEDDAPVPPESQSSPIPFDDSQSHKFTSMNTETATDNTVYSDDEPIPDDLGLLTVSGSDDSDDDDDNDSTDAEAPSVPPAAPQPTPRPAHPAKPAAATKAKLTAFFKVETAEEKAVRLEKDAREYREHAEEVRLRELELTRRKKAKARADGNERTRQYRDRIRAAKIADGYVPGTKRKRVDLLDDDPSLNPDPRLAELSRPSNAKNAKRDAKNINWQNPMFWSQIVAATRRAGRPWSPRAILKELHKSNPKDFQR
ncbi:hypothetical protein B0H13DRAFT_2318875 [Mycena leptocephala]|nr:hypothetical protein B0H13DRAFT_2318875 [Mycena leptocephala]